MHLWPGVAKQPNLELKTRPKQLLGSLSLVIVLPIGGYFQSAGRQAQEYGKVCFGKHHTFDKALWYWKSYQFWDFCSIYKMYLLPKVYPWFSCQKYKYYKASENYIYICMCVCVCVCVSVCLCVCIFSNCIRIVKNKHIYERRVCHGI